MGWVASQPGKSAELPVRWRGPQRTSYVAVRADEVGLVNLCRMELRISDVAHCSGLRCQQTQQILQKSRPQEFLAFRVPSWGRSGLLRDPWTPGLCRNRSISRESQTVSSVRLLAEAARGAVRRPRGPERSLIQSGQDHVAGTRPFDLVDRRYQDRPGLGRSQRNASLENDGFNFGGEVGPGPDLAPLPSRSRTSAWSSRASQRGSSRQGIAAVMPSSPATRRNSQT